MNVDMVVFDGAFTVENTYGNVKVATDPTAGADWTRRGLHTRPRSESLNLAVQDVFDTSIAERGINESLVHFIPEHVTHKEQQGYVKYFGKVKNFIDTQGPL